MDNLQEMEARLWAHIDGTNTAPERAAVQQLIEEHTAWRARHAELLELHQLLGGTELEQPSMRFTRNVMEGIAQLQIAPAAKSYINQKVIWGIALFFLTAIFGFLIYAIGMIDWKVGSAAETDYRIDFTAVDYSKFFNNTYTQIFMMLNVVLGLMLLDRFISNKRKKLYEGS